MPRTSPIGRVSYPSVFEPTQVQGAGEFKFRITLIFEPDDPKLAEMREAEQQAILKKWPTGKPAKYQSPFVDGDSLDQPETKGKIVVRFTAKEDRPPQVIDTDAKTPITKESGKFYSGCYGRVSYSQYGWTYAGKNGVSFGFNTVQFCRPGEALDGRTTADQDFDAIEPSEMADDDLPF